MGKKKLPIQSYMICLDNSPIGYIQLYNLHDFNHDKSILSQLPHLTGAIDFYIGEEAYLHKGMGVEILKVFLKKYAFVKFRYVYVSPKIANEKAVKCFQKAGFVVIKKYKDCFQMIAYRQDVRLSVKDAIELEKAFKIAFLPQDKLFIFGSRVDMNQLGGDIDLYIETDAELVEDAMNRKNIFVNELFKSIEEQKIDIVMNILNHL